MSDPSFSAMELSSLIIDDPSFSTLELSSLTIGEPFTAVVERSELLSITESSELLSSIDESNCPVLCRLVGCTVFNSAYVATGIPSVFCRVSVGLTKLVMLRGSGYYNGVFGGVVGAASITLGRVTKVLPTTEGLCSREFAGWRSLDAACIVLRVETLW